MLPQPSPPGTTGPPLAQRLPPLHAGPSPQRQLLVSASHHSPEAQQAPKQQAPLGHWLQVDPQTRAPRMSPRPPAVMSPTGPGSALRPQPPSASANTRRTGNRMLSLYCLRR